MAYEDNFDGLAGVHVIKEEMPNPNVYGNNILRNELGKLGVGTIIIPGSQKSYDNVGNGVIMGHPATGIDQIKLEPKHEYPIGKDGIEVVRSRVLLPSGVEGQVPVFNGPNLRKIGASKWEQYNLAHDFMPKTIALEADQEPSNLFFEKLNGSKLVVKADWSMQSKYLKICDRKEVMSGIIGMRNEFSDNEKQNNKKLFNKRIIVQEFVPGLTWQELEGIDENNKQKLTHANDTELRMYCYVDRDRKIPFEQRYYATARVFDESGKDEWASINQASVPSQAWYITDVISDRFLAKADVPGGYFAIDLIKGDANDGLGERILVREVNTRDPIMVNEQDNEYDFVIQRKLLANAMATIAKSQ